MKKIVRYFFVSIMFIALNGCSKSVYICTGEYSKRYHKTEECKGLWNCHAKIEETSLNKAKSMGRTPCEKCKP